MNNTEFIKIKPTHSSLLICWLVSFLVSLALCGFLLPFLMIFLMEGLGYALSGITITLIFAILTGISTFLLGSYIEKTSKMDAKVGHYIISSDRVEIVKAKSQSTTHFDKVNQITFKLDSARGKQGIGHITLNLGQGYGFNSTHQKTNQSNSITLQNIPNVQDVYDQLLVMFNPS